MIIGAKVSSIPNAERFKKHDRAKTQWMHDEEVEFLQGDPTTMYQKASPHHEATVGAALLYLNKFKQRALGFYFPLDAQAACAAMPKWDPIQRDLFAFTCGVGRLKLFHSFVMTHILLQRILRWFQRPKSAESSNGLSDPPPKRPRLMALLGNIMELFINRRAALGPHIYLTQNLDHVRSICRPLYAQEHPEILDVTVLTREQNAGFISFCTRYCKDIMSSSTPPADLSQIEWNRRLQDVEAAVEAQQALKDFVPLPSNSDIQAYVAQETSQIVRCR